MNTEDNPNLKQLDQLQSAKQRYEELRWRLAFLQTLSAERDPEPTEEEIINRHIHNNESRLNEFKGWGVQDHEMTPNIWFEQRFPSQAKQFGPAFLELRQTNEAGYTRTTPISINIDFFASIYSDPQLSLSVVYFEPEMEFYYNTAFQPVFRPVSQEKLQNLYRGFLIKCAQSFNDEVNILNLFHEFRSDKIAKQVTNRAKSILAADHTFFSGTSKHQRIKGPELYERLARVFVEQVLERVPGETLLITDAFLHFCEYLRKRNMPPVNRQVFKTLIPPAIRQEYEISIRNDIRDLEGGGWHCGWKGIRALLPEPEGQVN
jgi:hypothetical protein